MERKKSAAPAKTRTRGTRRRGILRYDAERLRGVMEHAGRQARIATMLASPLRCATLSLLSDGAVLSVGDVATLTQTTPALASYHVHQLAAEGVVTIEKSGREHHVRLNAAAFADMLGALRPVAPD